RWMNAATAQGHAARGAEEHLKRMEQLLADVKARHEADQPGGEGSKVAAGEFYVAEAKRRVVQSGSHSGVKVDAPQRYTYTPQPEGAAGAPSPNNVTKAAELDPAGGVSVRGAAAGIPGRTVPAGAAAPVTGHFVPAKPPAQMVFDGKSIGEWARLLRSD